MKKSRMGRFPADDDARGRRALRDGLYAEQSASDTKKSRGHGREEAAQADGAGISLSDMAAAEDAIGAESADTWPKTFTVTLGGDTTLGSTDDLRKREDCFENVAADKGYGWFFLRLANPVPATDDLTLVNFEGTLTEETSKKEKLYNLKARRNTPTS